MVTINLTPEQAAALTGGSGLTADQKKYVDVPAKPGELDRISMLEFAYTTLDEAGNKVWAVDRLPRKISRGVERADGNVTGGGNATFSTQTAGGGLHLPFGLDTEFRIGGHILPQGAVTGPRDTDDNKSVQRRESKMELVFDHSGGISLPENGCDPEDLYQVRALVTKGANPYFVKISAQRKGSTGFNGQNGVVVFEAYEGAAIA